MSKKIQDIQTKKRSVRNIRTKKGGSKNVKNGPPGRKRTPSSGGFWFIAVVFILFLFFAFSVVFSGTKILVEPKQADISVNGEFRASQGTSTTADTLGYEIMTITEEMEEEVTVEGEQQVEEKATGDILIYNDYTSEPFRLIENTRFESPNGNIYRTREAVTIPGKTAGTPGTVRATVDADKAGADYNIENARFSVPGLAGEPSYDSIYAETATAISGGFSGVQASVSEEEEVKARQALQEKLEQQLIKEARAQKPDRFILYDDSIFFSHESLPNKTENENPYLRQKATLRGILFDNQKLAQHLAEQHIETYQGNDVIIQNPDQLSFAILNAEAFDPTGENILRFSLEGETTIEWVFDAEELKQDFTGEEKGDIDRILARYPGIQQAEIVIRPFWKRSFPTNTEEIKVEKLLK